MRSPEQETALALLSEEYPADLRAKGDAYFEGDSVFLVNTGGALVQAFVLGRRRYEVLLQLNGDYSEGVCSCQAFRRFGRCKHVWAVIRALLEGPRRAATSTTTPAEDWRDRLRRIHSSVIRNTPPFPSPWSADTARRVRVRMECGLSLARDEVHLSAWVQERKKNGDWGTPKQRAIHSILEDEATTAEARRTLELLESAGELEPVSPYDWYQSRGRGDHVLGATAAVELLPRLAAHGLLEIALGDGTVESLEWDDGEPWRFLRSLRSLPNGDVALWGELARGEERLVLGSIRFAHAAGLVATEGRLARLDGPGTLPWLVNLEGDEPLIVTAEDAPALEQECAAIERRASVLETHGEPAELTPHLHVEPGTRTHSQSRVDCRITFIYGPGAEIPTDHSSAVVHGPDGATYARNAEAERARIAEYADLGGRRDRMAREYGDDGTLPAKHLPAVVRALLEEGWEVTAEGRRVRSPGSFSASVASGVDWFDLHGGVDFGSEVVPFPELLKAKKEGRDRVTLGDGTVGLLPEDWLEQWGLVELGEATKDGAIRFGSNQGWLLDVMLKAREGVDADETFERFQARLGRFSSVKPKREPRGFQGELRSYQRDALGWFAFLAELGLGGCLADDMGLGKTVQVLALLESRRRAKTAGPSIVVAPRSLVFNWLDEARRFAPRLVALDFTGPDRHRRRAEAGRVDLLVTTYGTLRRDAPKLTEERFDYVVLDEATAIKNEGSQAAKAARLVVADHRLALTGTPIENHLGELWSLMEFLNPGMLGRSRKFKDLVGKDVAPERRAELARAVRPFFLRRTKDEVLTELPPKSEQILRCELSKPERRRYDELRDHYRAALLGNAEEDPTSGSKFQVLEALLRLRQAACHPGLLDPEYKDEDSAKLTELLPRIEELAIEGHKVLVFSQFTKLLAIVRARLERAKVAYEYLDGRTRKRKERVERFESDPSVPIFLISLKAGGHGLNLTSASYVFLLDPWWNPAVEAQAVDRAHRMGQTRPVSAYRMIASDTVEERVLELQDEKRALAESLLGDGQAVLRDLTREDLETLLS